MRDEQIGEAEIPLQLFEQRQDLRLHGDVERRHRLVEHQNLRIEDQRAGDGDALPLAARQSPRLAAAAHRRQADPFHHRRNPVEPLCRRDPLEIQQRLLDDPADRLARIERAERVLIDELDVLAETAAASRPSAR